MVCQRFCFLEDFSVILTNNFLSVEYYFYNWTENKLIFRFLETHYSVFKLFLCTKDMVYHSAYNTNDILITLNHSLRNYHKFLKKWFNNTDNSVWVMNNEITNVFHTKKNVSALSVYFITATSTMLFVRDTLTTTSIQENWNTIVYLLQNLVNI